MEVITLQSEVFNCAFGDVSLTFTLCYLAEVFGAERTK